MPKLTDWIKEQAARREPPPPENLKHARYKVNGRTVYMDGQKLPRPCARCGGFSAFTCDFPVTEGVLCNAPLCPEHAKAIAPDRHLCPIHAKRVQTMQGSLL